MFLIYFLLVQNLIRIVNKPQSKQNQIKSKMEKSLDFGVSTNFCDHQLISKSENLFIVCILHNSKMDHISSSVPCLVLIDNKFN